MKVIQIFMGVIWVAIMYMVSTTTTDQFLTLGTGVVFVIMCFMGGDDKRETVKAKKISIQYKDGKKETCAGTEWSRYDDVLSIYNNELEDNLVKEISLDVVKSVGFAPQESHE